MNKKLRNNIFLKISILLIFIINSFCLKAQSDCEIKLTDGVSLPVCYGEEISLSVTYDPNCSYQWFKKGIMMSGENSFYLTTTITENNVKYSVVVTNDQTQEECSLRSSLSRHS